MILRTAGLADITAIQQIAETTWWSHYPGIISDDQIRYMLHRMYATATLVQAMDAGHRIILAEDSGTAIAFCQSEDQAEWRFIHKLYALPASHGRGIGRMLLEDVTHAAAGKPLRLHVNRHNPSVGFYQAQGFCVLKEQITDIGDGHVMDDYVMVRA